MEECALLGIGVPQRDLIELKDLKQRDAQFSVILVVGMDGIGKTTLVRKVFNDKAVIRHFPLHAWITVSHTLWRVDVLRILANQFHIAAKETV